VARTLKCSSSRPMRPRVKPAKTPPDRMRITDVPSSHQKVGELTGGSSGISGEGIAKAKVKKDEIRYMIIEWRDI
jgi:hypothetical protein